RRSAPCRYTALFRSGSPGGLRSALDLPAPGDIRRCIEAMAGPAGTTLARALGYRFGGSDVEGHALGNLLLAGLHAVTGDFGVAGEELEQLAGIDTRTGRVPAGTLAPVGLRAGVGGGGEVTGRVAITGTVGIEQVVLDPPDAAAPAEAVEAILGADQVVLGPGSLFTSVLAAAVVEDVRSALK